jgi:hypothetical protein
MRLPRTVGRVGRLTWLSAALGACFAALAVDSACSSTASLVAAGGACELASDCEEGLVCIPDTSSATGRSCSSDLSSIQETEFPDTGTDATMEGDGSDDGAATTYPTGDDGGGSSPDATMPQDSGSTPPQDSGTPVKDSGTTPPPDAGPADAGHD